jgi:hypothetical protein
MSNSSTDQNQTLDKPDEKSEPKFSGLAIAGAFWWWAIVCAVCPTYYGIDTWPKFIFYGLTVISLFVTIVLAFFDLAGLLDMEPLKSWGFGIAFLFLSAAFFVFERQITNYQVFSTFIKFMTLLLASIGGALVSWGFSDIQPRSKPTNNDKTDPVSSPPTDSSQESARTPANKTIDTAKTVTVALLTLATAIVSLIRAIRTPP